MSSFGCVAAGSTPVQYDATKVVPRKPICAGQTFAAKAAKLNALVVARTGAAAVGAAEVVTATSLLVAVAFALKATAVPSSLAKKRPSRVGVVTVFCPVTFVHTLIEVAMPLVVPVYHATAPPLT